MFNRKFLKKSWDTIHQIRTIGLYDGDIVCIIADDLFNHQNLLCKDGNIIIKHFKQNQTYTILNDLRKLPDDPILKNRVRACFPMWQKMIHYHKFYIFHSWFRNNYKKCLYIDTGTQIFNPLNKIINLDSTGKLYAHSNAYPRYELGDKLYIQFDKVLYPDLYEELNLLYNMNVDHFQATVMLYDTSIIEDSTFEELTNLAYRYVNCKTNDQGIMNLYFGCIKHCWKQFPIKDEDTYYYDFFERGNLKKIDYIMVKYPQT
jgi:hypothetical protein